MQIDIQARSFPLTVALRNYIKQRLVAALTRRDEHIQKIVMRLSDINGPRGGEDKHCHLQIVLAGIPDVVIEDTEIDMYNAIDRATERAERAVVRKINKKRTKLKHTRHLTTSLDSYTLA
jgi:putative sigma-54 modulation protein